jgi:hypothetical protein
MTPRSSFRPLLPAVLSLLFLSACGKPTYQADRLDEAVRDICKREYDFDASARTVGKTLYASIKAQRLVTPELGLQKETIERLYDALLAVTRVALSTDAKIDFLVVKARDASTGVTLTLVRYVPDIKWYFYMRISRADFESRGIMEIDAGETPDDPASWKDISMEEFIARLAASMLQQKITYNPLVSASLRVHKVQGTFKDGVLTVRMDKFERVAREGRKAARLPNAADEVLRRVVVERVGDVVQKYDEKRSVQRVRVVDDQARAMFDFSREELLAAFKKLPKSEREEE